MDKLTPEQAELVEANMGLVYYVLYKQFGRLVKKDGIDDWAQVGFLGLCSAALRYSPEQGTKFSTYAVPAIRSAILNQLRYERQLCRYAGADDLSMDALQTGDEDIDRYDMIADPYQDVERLMRGSEIARTVNELYKSQPLIVEAAIGRITQQEAARLLGESQPNVSRKIALIRQKLKEEEHGQNQHGRDR